MQFAAERHRLSRAAATGMSDPEIIGVVAEEHGEKPSI
jgi:hypothetical protein